MKAVILAAGKGARLLPLTLTTPKPLLQAGGRRLLDYSLERMATAGVSEVLINVHHLANQIQDYVGDGSHWGLKVHWFVEPKLLDTGGALRNMLPVLGDSPCVVLSADIWTDYPLQQLLVSGRNNALHLLLVPNPPFHRQGDFQFQSAAAITGQVQQKNSGLSYNYGGYAVVQPALIRQVEEAVFPMRRLMDLAIAEQSCTGELWSGRWFNVGTIEQLASLDAALQ